MTIHVQLFDGTPLEFEEGTPPDVIQQTVQRLSVDRAAADAGSRSDSWGTVLGKAVGNMPKSAVNTAAGIVSAPFHVGDMLDAANGALQSVLPDQVNDFMHQIAPGTADNKPKGDALIDFYKNRYGSEGGIKKSIAEDPFGVALDASTVLSGGGALTGLLPGARAASVANGISKTGRAIDPIINASKLANMGIQVAGAARAPVVGNVGRILARAADMQDDPAALADRIRAGNTPLITDPTTAQAAIHPGISQLERTVRNINGSALVGRANEQHAARNAALQGVNGVDPFGLPNLGGTGSLGLSKVEAADDAGKAIRGEWDQLRGDIKGVEHSLFNHPSLNNLSFTIPTDAIRGAIEEYFPGSTFDQAPGYLKSIVNAGPVVKHPELQKLRSLAGETERDLMNTDATGRAAAGAVKKVLSNVYDNAIANGTGKMSGYSGAITDIMPPDAAEVLAAARQYHAMRKGTLESGPGFNMTQTGTDKLPKLSDGEIPKAWFNGSAGQSSDIAQFNKALATGYTDSRAALQKYALTSLWDHAVNKDGIMSATKFDNWMDAHSGALKGLFSPEQLKQLETIRADAIRQERGLNEGRAVGSNTEQNRQGTHQFGILSSMVKDHAPIPPAIRKLNDLAAWGMTRPVIDALLDPAVAANALDVFGRMQRPNAMQLGLGGLMNMAPLLNSFTLEQQGRKKREK